MNPTLIPGKAPQILTITSAAARWSWSWGLFRLDIVIDALLWDAMRLFDWGVGSGCQVGFCSGTPRREG